MKFGWQFTVDPDKHQSFVASLEAERDGCDAFIIGTFAGPALSELRALCSIPNLSVSEASGPTACSVGLRSRLLGLSAEAESAPGPTAYP